MLLPLMYRQILENLEKNSIDAYMINTNDEHLNEYIGPSDERLKNITKFTGSNGLILISKDKSYLYTDGRYHIQARTELEDGNFILITEIEDFYSKCKDFATIGINKKQFEQNTVAKLTKKGLKLVDHSIDYLLELPERKYNKIIDLETIMAKDFLKSDKLREVVKEYFNWLDYDSIDLDINVSGSLRHDKFELLREKMKNHDIFIVTALDEVAYLFNLRGNDIVFNPVFYAYAVVTKDEIILFANEDIQLQNIQIMKYESFYDHIEAYRDKKIYVSDSCNAYAYEKLSANNTVTMSPIIADIKSSKNNVELLGFIQAHIYDGCALSELFDFMREELHNNHDLTEAFITKKLKTIKEQYAGFFTPSFETISSTGANAAIIHHQGGEDKIDPDQLYLIDSGSQYFFGTTDITRTMVFNEPNQDQKEIFTKVLKQQLRPMLTNLPVDYPSFALDAFSRLEAWDDKIDYEHSLGHGVGHFLNVHESPPSLSKYGGVLKDRMVFSIEPGRYIEGVHGVRIEDLVVSVKEDKFFSFKNITLSPLQENLIDLNMLTAKEQEYVKRYNEKVNNIISKFKIDKENGHENPLIK